MNKRKWKFLVPGAISAIVIAAMLVPSSRNTILGGFIHRTGSQTTQTSLFAANGGMQREPDITMPPSEDGSHTGEIWKDPSGAELHGGKGHTGADSPYHLHPHDPDNPGHRLPGPGIPVDEKGNPINNPGHNTLTIPENSPDRNIEIYPLPDREKNRDVIGYPIPAPINNGPLTAKPGGILLSPTVLNNLGNLKGAVYDPKTHSLVVVGARQNLPAISESELAVLLKCALDGTDPAFSLDPADPGNPMGPHLKCRYIPETLRGTTVGMDLYSCDIRMKHDTLGLQSPGIPGFKNLFELGFAGSGRQNEGFCRMWNEAQSVEIRRSGNSIIFDDVNMQIKTEKMIASRLGLASTGEEDPDALWIADFLTANYSELPGEYQKIKQLAAVYALAKFLVDQDTQIDRNWLRNAIVRVETPDIIDAANVTRKKESTVRKPTPSGVIIETTTQTITIHGGIHLCVTLPPDTRDPAAGRLASYVTQTLRGSGDTTEFTLPDKTIAAVVKLK